MRSRAGSLPAEVITQALTFVATCYADAWPVFVDVDRDTLKPQPGDAGRLFGPTRRTTGGRGIPTVRGS